MTQQRDEAPCHPRPPPPGDSPQKQGPPPAAWLAAARSWVLARAQRRPAVTLPGGAPGRQWQQPGWAPPRRGLCPRGDGQGPGPPLCAGPGVRDRCPPGLAPWGLCPAAAAGTGLCPGAQGSRAAPDSRGRGQAGARGPALRKQHCPDSSSFSSYSEWDESSVTVRLGRHTLPVRQAWRDRTPIPAPRPRQAGLRHQRPPAPAPHFVLQ